MTDKMRNLLLGAALVFVILFFMGLFTDNYPLRMIAKPFPLIVLLVLLKPTSHYRKFIFGGLAFSLLGDILLESSPDMFVFGLLAFLTGHIFYAIAFIRRNKTINLMTAVFMLAYGVLIYWILLPGLNQMAIPVMLYVLVILVMAWRAVSQRPFDAYATFAMIGAFLFVFSDSLIALNKFYTPIDYSRGIIMLTYWMAQAFIFYSAYRSEKTQD